VLEAWSDSTITISSLVLVSKFFIEKNRARVNFLGGEIMGCLNQHVLFILLTIFIGSAYGEHEHSFVFVSLGKDCEVAMQLRALELRKLAYPFDWVVALEFEGIYGILANRFKDFLNPHYLKHAGIWPGATNFYYNVSFVHDFPSVAHTEWVAVDEATYMGVAVDNFLDYLDGVTQKYTKRIDRLLALLDGSIPVVFIRTHITPIEAQNFVTMMEKVYPLADYQLLVVHGNPSFDFNWNIARVESFYAQKKDPREKQAKKGWFHADEWRDALIKVGFVEPTQ